LEWLRYEKQPPQTLDEFRANVLKKCPELAWLRDVAEAGKHRGLNRTSVTVKRVLPSWVKILGTFGTFAIGTMPYGGRVVTGPLSIELDDGTTHNFSDVLSRVIDFWRNNYFPPKKYMVRYSAQKGDQMKAPVLFIVAIAIFIAILQAFFPASLTNAQPTGLQSQPYDYSDPCGDRGPHMTTSEMRSCRLDAIHAPPNHVEYELKCLRAAAEHYDSDYEYELANIYARRRSLFDENSSGVTAKKFG